MQETQVQYLGSILEKGNSNPPIILAWENSMDTGALQLVVCGITKGPERVWL